MAITTKDPNSVGGMRKAANHAMSSNASPHGSNHPKGNPPKARMPSAYLTKNHAPYEGKHKPARGSISGPPGVSMPKTDISRTACAMPMLKTTKAD